MRYAGADNFTGRPLPGYQAPRCVLRHEAAVALAAAQRLALAAGYALKVYDCYRPARAVRAFAAWARDAADQATRDYYPRLAKRALHRDGYIASRSEHSRGHVVDLTLVPLPAAPQPPLDAHAPHAACTAAAAQRAADNGLDMGTSFDCFDSLSHTANAAVGAAAQRHRQLLTTLMADAGFTNYWREWWHFSYAGKPLPRVYHDFPIVAPPAAGR
jgi:D-alanyl-D-alanine dipeptidase